MELVVGDAVDGLDVTGLGLIDEAAVGDGV